MGFALICPDGAADEKLIAFVEMEAAIRPPAWNSACTKSLLATQLSPQGSQAEQTETEQRNCRAAIRHPSSSDDEREVLIR